MLHKTKEFFIPQDYQEAFNIIKKLDDKFVFLAGGVTINWHGNAFPYLISLEKIIDSSFFIYLPAHKPGLGARAPGDRKYSSRGNTRGKSDDNS